MGAVRWTRNGIRKPDDEIAELDDVYQTNQRAAATPDETHTVQQDYDSQEKLVCKLEPYNVCYRINLNKREIVPTEQVRSNYKKKFYLGNSGINTFYKT